MISTISSYITTSLLPSVYVFGYKFGQTIVKYYVLLLSSITTKVLQQQQQQQQDSSSSSAGYCSNNDDSNINSTLCNSNNDDRYMNNTEQQQTTTPNLYMIILVLFQTIFVQLPKQMYHFIITFPGWYSEWWWNLVQNDPIHVLVETILLLAIFYFLLSSRRTNEGGSSGSGGTAKGNNNKRNKGSNDRLTKAEEDELIWHWKLFERHPLTPGSGGNGGVPGTGSTVGTTTATATTTTSSISNTIETEYQRTLVIHKTNGRYMEVEEIQQPPPPVSTATTSTTTTLSSASVTTVPTIVKVLNFATMDFLGMSADTLPNPNDDDNDYYMENDDNNKNHSKRNTTTTNNNNNTATTATATVHNKEQQSQLQLPLHPVKVASLEALDRYGCGSCGPRGFYGTIDVHIQIEKDIAQFFHTEDAILYSDGASTVTSTVAAFCKRGDIIVVDEAVYEPIRTGTQLSRANVNWFAHNNMQDLRRVLTKIQQSDKKLGRKSNAQRRFIIVEGLYKNTGTICPLNEIIQLKHEFNYRLIVDESYSFGTLGETGRGVTELYNNRLMHDVEIMCVSLENSMGSIGGLTTGTEEVVDHQRLSGSGYAYSASSPPFTASAAIAALNLLQTHPELTLHRLQRNIQYLHQQLKVLLHEKLEDLLCVTSDVRSPIVMLQVADIPETEYLDDHVFLQEVVRESFLRGIAFVATSNDILLSQQQQQSSGVATAAGTVATTSGLQLPPSIAAVIAGGTGIYDVPQAGIRMTVSAVHTLSDIDLALQVLGESVDVVMSRFYDEETTIYEEK